MDLCVGLEERYTCPSPIYVVGSKLPISRTRQVIHDGPAPSSPGSKTSIWFGKTSRARTPETLDQHERTHHVSSYLRTSRSSCFYFNFLFSTLSLLFLYIFFSASGAPIKGLCHSFAKQIYHMTRAHEPMTGYE